MLCKLAKDFEKYCEEMLQSGMELAQESRSAHQSHVSSAVHEPSLSGHLMTKLYQQRSNIIRVFIPQERKTGGDLEIHVRLPGKHWIGLIIQAKRVDINHKNKYFIPELIYRDGAQYKELIDYAEISLMLPMYMFYLPSGAVHNLSNRSGAMLCNASDLYFDVENNRTDLDKFFPFLTKLSTLLCSLDNGREQEFVRKLEKMFVNKKTLGYSPRNIGKDFPPTYVTEFINTGTVPPRWLTSNISGAITIDLSQDD